MKKGTLSYSSDALSELGFIISHADINDASDIRVEAFILSTEICLAIWPDTDELLKSSCSLRDAMDIKRSLEMSHRVYDPHSVSGVIKSITVCPFPTNTLLQ